MWPRDAHRWARLAAPFPRRQEEAGVTGAGEGAPGGGEGEGLCRLEKEDGGERTGL